MLILIFLRCFIIKKSKVPATHVLSLLATAYCGRDWHGQIYYRTLNPVFTQLVLGNSAVLTKPKGNSDFQVKLYMSTLSFEGVIVFNKDLQ